jgi:hypothetical protein
MGEDFYRDSGKIFKWISILRAADYVWSNENKFGFIRLAEEGVSDTSPQIIAVCWDRSEPVFYLIFTYGIPASRSINLVEQLLKRQKVFKLCSFIK